MDPEQSSLLTCITLPQQESFFPFFSLLMYRGKKGLITKLPHKILVHQGMIQAEFPLIVHQCAKDVPFFPESNFLSLSLFLCRPILYPHMHISFFYRYLFVTFLRDPVKRYLSEWLHVAMGGNIAQPRYGCDEDFNQFRSVERCYKIKGSDSWLGVSLHDFMHCPFNPATNRQTWMLADVESIGCDKLKYLPADELKTRLLNSAKRNLMNSLYFGISEFREDAADAIKDTFGLKFTASFPNEKNPEEINDQFISESEEKSVYAVNDMDVELYQFAKFVYNKRYH